MSTEGSHYRAELFVHKTEEMKGFEFVLDEAYAVQLMYRGPSALFSHNQVSCPESMVIRTF